MFPIEFDHEALESLPLPDDEGSRRILQILRAVCMARIMPYFRNRRIAESTAIARVSSSLTLRRWEDENRRIPMVSQISLEKDRWVILIHERIFDFIAFVIPSDPHSRLGGKTSEEGKMLAFAEFFLRHQIEHLLYPGKTQREVIASDAAFAMEKRIGDPTFYRMLRAALADEMNGIRGSGYLELLDAAEQERPLDPIVAKIFSGSVARLSELPDEWLQNIFPPLKLDLKKNILEECYRKSRNTSYSLKRRSVYLETVMRLFAVSLHHDEKGTREVLQFFRDRYGLIYLFRELDLPEMSLENGKEEELFEAFKEHVAMFSAERQGACPAAPPTLPRVEPSPAGPQTKSLKDRIEEARNDPLFPRRAIEIIDKNKTAAVGHSGPKYTELIETLLAIPWGKVQRIEVDAGSFEEGLNRTHYGLKGPKEIICDFFANLIWRYRNIHEEGHESLHRTGSAFLFVGPPGVGKTSMAISIARNLAVPYHKISLGGMKDEADLRGYGFTYEGSKPGAVLQGLIKMGAMNGVFILDEADKTEPFAIATLLEILDPEQNHLFHDKYTETTLDIDLSCCHFILTANTLETVPPAVVNRCEVVFLDRYSVEEKIAIARQYLVERVRNRYGISQEEIFFDPDHEEDLLRTLITTYTREPGVRELERIIRTLFLRIFRKEVLDQGHRKVRVNRIKVREYLEPPGKSWGINEEDRVGEALALGVNVERGIGSVIPIQATPIHLREEGTGGENDRLSTVHATGNIEKVMDESRKVAMTAILYCGNELGIDASRTENPIHLHLMGASTPKDGPSAGGAIALALASLLSERSVRRDLAMTGEIDTRGRITGVGGIDIKLETAYDAGCRTMIIPKENLTGHGGIERLPDALKRELQILTYAQWRGEHEPVDYGRHTLQVIGVDHITQAAEVAFIDEEEIRRLEDPFVEHARTAAEGLNPLKDQAGFCVHLIKDPQEIDLEADDETLREGRRRVFLFKPEVRRGHTGGFPVIERYGERRDLGPSRVDLPSIIHEIEADCTRSGFEPCRASLVAPYYLLTQSGLDPGSKGFKVFSNNYAIQGIKIKECRSLLNRAFYYLSHLSPAALEGCFFLKRRNGIYSVDLGFIPEKYRLDLRRAERILNTCLERWLNVLEGTIQEDHRTGATAMEPPARIRPEEHAGEIMLHSDVGALKVGP
jgi:ATP-dependent Lon protease